MLISITIRIPEDLKRKMDGVKKVNWSEVVRRAIVDRLKMGEKLKTKNWEFVARASKKSDDIRESFERLCGKSDYDSAETIRSWRDARLWKEQS